MTDFITALTDDKARLIVKEARVSHDKAMADLIAKAWADQGFIVVRREEN
jgi:hypothetical protein